VGSLFKILRNDGAVCLQNRIGGVYKKFSDRTASGVVFQADQQSLSPAWQGGFESARCFAYPLTDFSSEADIRQKVIVPLNDLAQ
jgi:hypothetical protein